MSDKKTCTLDEKIRDYNKPGFEKHINLGNNWVIYNHDIKHAHFITQGKYAPYWTLCYNRYYHIDRKIHIKLNSLKAMHGVCNCEPPQEILDYHKLLIDLCQE